MKLTSIVEELNDNDYQSRLEVIKNICNEIGQRTEGDFVVLYHGTSPANHKKILKSGKFKSGTWFGNDFETAKKFGNMTISRGECVVQMSLIYMGALYYNGYFSSTCDLYFKNGKYQPKDINL